jgi:hypothetical protein
MAVRYVEDGRHGLAGIDRQEDAHGVVDVDQVQMSERVGRQREAAFEVGKPRNAARAVDASQAEDHGTLADGVAVNELFRLDVDVPTRVARLTGGIFVHPIAAGLTVDSRGTDEEKARRGGKDSVHEVPQTVKMDLLARLSGVRIMGHGKQDGRNGWESVETLSIGHVRHVRE